MNHSDRLVPALTLLALASLSSLALVGCGGSSPRAASASSAAATTSGTAPVTSALSWRGLERGQQSGIATLSTRTAASDAEWSALWQAHAGSGAPPVVDFSQERVVGVFLGQRPSDGYAIQIEGVARVGSQVEVRFRRNSPALGQSVGKVLTSPYDLVAINETHSPLVFVDQTPPPVTRALSGHGELVDAGGSLAFLPDGASEALELIDPSALQAAGAHAGWTLALVGEAEPNSLGATALPEALRVATFELDDLVSTGELYTLRTLVPPSPTLFRDDAGTSYEPVGPLAAALLAHPGRTPVRVWGRVRGAGTYGTELEVSAWEPVTTLSLNDTRPLLSSLTVALDDVLGSAAYRVEGFEVAGGGQASTTRGRGRALPTSLADDLRQSIRAADLRSHPSRYAPAQIYPDHPSVSLTINDLQGPYTVTVYGGARTPPAISDLIQRLQALPAAVPTARSLREGDQSALSRPGAEVARDAAELSALYQRLSPLQRPPAIDFTQDVIAAAYAGQQPTGGYRLSFSRVEQIGPALYLTSELLPPGGIAPSVLTAPYVLVRLTRTGGPIFLDGRAR